MPPTSINHHFLCLFTKYLFCAILENSSWERPGFWLCSWDFIAGQLAQSTLGGLAWLLDNEKNRDKRRRSQKEEKLTLEHSTTARSQSGCNAPPMARAQSQAFLPSKPASGKTTSWCPRQSSKSSKKVFPPLLSQNKPSIPPRHFLVGAIFMLL